MRSCKLVKYKMTIFATKTEFGVIDHLKQTQHTSMPGVLRFFLPQMALVVPDDRLLRLLKAKSFLSSHKPHFSSGIRAAI